MPTPVTTAPASTTDYTGNASNVPADRSAVAMKVFTGATPPRSASWNYVTQYFADLFARVWAKAGFLDLASTWTAKQTFAGVLGSTAPVEGDGSTDFKSAALLFEHAAQEVGVYVSQAGSALYIVRGAFFSATNNRWETYDVSSIPAPIMFRVGGTGVFMYQGSSSTPVTWTERWAARANTGLIEQTYAALTGSSAPAVTTVAMGRATILAGTNKTTITHASVTATSVIRLQIEGASEDSTCVRLRVNPGAGAFDVWGNSNATNPVTFSFEIRNPTT